MNERVIFDAALEIADPQARRAFVEKACAGDPEMLAAVESLLKSHDAAGSFLDIPAGEQIKAGAPGHPTDTSSADELTRRYQPDAIDEDSEDDADASQPDLSFLQPSSKPGSIGVLGHYEVLSVLGQGAFGIVFKAFDEKLHRLVAIKVMNPQMASTSPPRKRFLREARSAAAIKHENIVQVYSVEEQPLPYLVMEFIDGQTLKQKLDGSGPLETPEVLHIARQIASGLAAAQAMGLIHRDIKPANILLEEPVAELARVRADGAPARVLANAATSDIRVKISDFGLARAADDASMTRTGVISGTPMYMAPEQATGQALDHRADLFSFGSVLYQMACGRPPFRASNTVAVLRRVVEDTPRPLQEILPEIPNWLVAIVTKLNAKKPEDRFQTAKEVADLLARCQSELQLNGKVTCVPVAPSSPVAPRQESRTSLDTDHANDPQSTSDVPRAPGLPVAERQGYQKAPKSIYRWLVAAAAIVLILAAAIWFQRANQTTTPNLASRAASAPGQAESPDSADPDRRAAEWVLSIGGSALIRTGKETVEAKLPLPENPFRVMHISLHQCKISDRDALKRISNLLELTDFHMTYVDGLTDESIQKITNVPKLSAVRLSARNLTDASLIHLSQIAPLRFVSFAQFGFTDKAAKALQSCPMEVIYLDGATDAEVRRLRQIPKLKWLRMSLHNQHPVSLDACESLNELPDLKSLEILGFNEPLDQKRQQVLKFLATRPQLDQFRISFFNLTDDDIAFLDECRQLIRLDLTNVPKLTRPAIEKLAAALPKCRIEWDGGLIEPRTGWHGWSADAPPPAIAPFDAEQAKQHQAAWAKYLNVPVEYTNSLGMKFRLIPPGEFTMGSTASEIEDVLDYVGEEDVFREWIKSEGPQHKVILTHPIYMGVHEVTQTEYEKVTGLNPSFFTRVGSGKNLVAGLDTTKHPVEMVSWNDAVEFCTKLSEQEKLRSFYSEISKTTTVLNDAGYRLPSEAQWEFSCRGGTDTKYWTGNEDEDFARAAWFDRNAGGQTHRVGALNANPFGLHDMLGNVWEWVNDGWDSTFYRQLQNTTAVNPSCSFSSRPNRVIRGGDWRNPAFSSRSSHRISGGRSVRNNNGIGFRASLPVDAVRQALKDDGAKIVKPGVPVGANGNPVANQGRSAWDDLDPAQIPEAERVPRQPEGLVAVLGQHRRRVWMTPHSSSVSPDGTQFTLTNYDGLYLFGRDPRQSARFFNYGVMHPSATFLPDGRIAAFVLDEVAARQQLQIFAKPRDGEPLEKQTATIANHNSEEILNATASSDGHWLAAFDYPASIGLWRLVDYPLQRAAKFVLPTPHGGISPGSFSPDAQWFCFTDNSNVQSAVHLIDLRGDTPREATVLKADADEKSDAPAKGFEHAAFLSDGRLATADRNGRTWFWNINDGEPQRVGSIPETGLLYSATKSLRLAIFGARYGVWDLAADPPKMLGTCAHSFEQDNILTVAIAPNGETVFTSHLNGAVRFWNVSQSGVTELDPLIPNPRNKVYGRTKVADHLLCAAWESSRLGIWRPTPDGLQAVPIVSPAFMVLDASPTRRQLIVRESLNGGGTALLRYDADRVTQTRRIPGDSVYSAALNDEGHRLAIGRHNGADFVLELWGWESDDLPAKKLFETKTSPDHVVQLAFAEAGRTLVGRLGPQIQIWDVKKEDELIPRVSLPQHNFLQFAVAPDGQTLATVDDGTLELWNLKSDLTQPTASFTISGTNAVAFSPDGRRLAASFWENGASAGVQIINLATGVVEKRLTFPGRVHELTFTDDNRHLITGNANATIYVVRLP